jgi:hypothetical protein
VFVFTSLYTADFSLWPHLLGFFILIKLGIAIHPLLISALGLFTQLWATAIKHKFIGKPLKILTFYAKILLFIGVKSTQ